MQIEFYKYEGAGNDFILIDNRDGVFHPEARNIQRLCDRHFGIGADGLMTLTHHDTLDCSMHYYNADGSEGAMCGNGARCFALFAHHLNIGGSEKHFAAPDGEHCAQLINNDDNSGVVELGMIDVKQITEGNEWWSLNTGVPHYVEFMDNVAATDVTSRGATIRHDTARFAEGTNVNFVQVLGEGSLRMRTYERGVENETLACGTGATAAAIVTHYALQPGVSSFKIEVPGGELAVRFIYDTAQQIYTNIRLTGAARRVFKGQFEI